MPGSDVLLWLDKAPEDEATVAVLKSAGGPWSVAAYHIQQAAEKHLKAALVSQGIAPPKTHDLQQLLSLSAVSPTGDVSRAAAMTSAYAWMTRYPGAPSIEEKEVLEAEMDLNTIRAWAGSVIHRSST